VLAACGGSSGHPAPARPIERPPAHATTEPAKAPATTQADCERLIAHVVELDPHASKLADADRDHVRAQLQSELGAECLTKPRAVVLCGIDAPTSDAIAACDQPMPSSSTSNSSVAPPGITPAAPRSP
jgi:hypothetical protein